MPTSPSTQFTSLRPDLAGSLEQFDLQADQAGFVGLKIAPTIEVDTPFGQYGVIELKELIKSRDTRRAVDGSYGRGEGRGTKDTYSTEEHGFEERVDDREATMFGSWWNSELLAAQRCRDAVLRNHNARVIALAAAVSNTTAAGTVWTTLASADVIGNVRTARLAVRNRTGIMPNAMVIDFETFQYVRSNAGIIDRVKYSGLQDVNVSKVTVNAVAQALDLEEIILSGSMYNSANEAQTASLASMWDKTTAFVFVKGSGSDLRRPQFARTFHWGADGSSIGSVMESYRDESRRSDIVRSRMETDEKVVYSACAQLITGVQA